MRGSRNAQVATGDDGAIYAISLGADFVSEHEWGIERTYRQLGIDPHSVGKNPLGVMSRVNTAFPDNMHMKVCDHKPRKGSRGVGYQGVLLGMFGRHDIETNNLDPRELREFYDSPGYVRDGDDDMHPITAAWSDGDFAVFVRKIAEVQFIKDLYQAFQDNNVVVWLGGGGVFQNAGLCFGILDRMPESFVAEFLASDQNAVALQEADMDTGIKARLQSAGEAHNGGSIHRKFGYYALRPEWATEFKSTKGDVITEHKVIYWLNPYEQDDNNSGWYTVEQLDQWIAGEGPIPKTDEQKQRRYG